MNEYQKRHDEMVKQMAVPPVTVGPAAANTTVTGQLQQQYDSAILAQRVQHHTVEENLSTRLDQLEDFIRYAADVSPDFNKLLVGWRARKRLGIEG